jgi:uncharacterized membrane protein required for colicin V production
VLKGFRTGLIGQLTGVIGLAFGVVCSHLFKEPAKEIIADILPFSEDSVVQSFALSIFSTVAVYVIIFAVFSALKILLQSAVQIFRVGLLNSIGGSAFCLLKYMMGVSIVYNLILCFNPDSKLLKYATASDGNIVEGVLMLAPTILGGENAEDLAHRIQLKDAKKISINKNGSNSNEPNNYMTLC